MIIWRGIIVPSVLVGPFFGKKVVKLNSVNYVKFLEVDSRVWINRKSNTLDNNF